MKRKCSGSQPCHACLRYEYQCYFDPHSSKIRRDSYRAADRKETSAEVSTLPRASNRPDPTRLVTATEQTESYLRDTPSPQYKSGTNFAQDLKGQLSHDGSRRLKSDSWNLGVRADSSTDSLSLTDLISIHSAQKFSDVYFEKIHPVYGIISREHYQRKLIRRWGSGCPTTYDAVLCGVIGLGSLFSGIESARQETVIIERAKAILENSTPTLTAHAPASELASSWVLRCLYLRMAVEPHAAWIASRTTMQLIAENYHQTSNMPRDEFEEGLKSSFCLKTDDWNGIDESRVFWVANVLNYWICTEYARPRSQWEALTKLYPPPLIPIHLQDFTPVIVKIYQISIRIARVHGQVPTAEHLLQIIEDISNLLSPDTHDVLLLHKAIQGFCLYRALRSSTSSIPPSVPTQIIQFGSEGVRAALRLAEDKQPWWHIANVPFQFLCVLLAMDTRESLCQVELAMQALRRIAWCFDTSKMRRVVSTAEELVRLSQKKKLDDARTLGRVTMEDHSSGVQTTLARVDNAAAVDDDDRIDVVPDYRSICQLGHDSSMSIGPSTSSTLIDRSPYNHQYFQPQFEISEPFDWDDFLNTEFPNQFT